MHLLILIACCIFNHSIPCKNSLCLLQMTADVFLPWCIGVYPPYLLKFKNISFECILTFVTTLWFLFERLQPHKECSIVRKHTTISRVLNRLNFKLALLVLFILKNPHFKWIEFYLINYSFTLLDNLAMTSKTTCGGVSGGGWVTSKHTKWLLQPFLVWISGLSSWLFISNLLY